MADAKRIVQAKEDSDEVAEFVEDVDEHSLEAFAAHFENECQHSSGLEDAAGSETLADVESAWSRFEDAYSGTWDSETAYVEDMIDSGCFGNVDENSLLQNYIDIESLTRDMFMCDMTAIQTGRGSEVHVYHNY
jgi:antirestriction protein